jgi:hypothetical protein
VEIAGRSAVVGDQRARDGCLADAVRSDENDKSACGGPNGGRLHRSDKMLLHVLPKAGSRDV